MDITAIITIASIVIANIGTTILLFTWATSHAAQDNRELRDSTNKLVESIRQDIRAIHEEIKDFHGRLIKIEERGK